jgi:hypothetical protein
MLFVFLSHFAVAYLSVRDLPVTYLYAITMIASPAFLSISGVMLGILFATRGDYFEVTKARYVRRGIFLLTVGKALILIAHVPMAGGWREALRWGPMTDAIGFSFILTPFLVEKLNRHTRVIVGVLIFCVSWVVILLWVPHGFVPTLLKETFFGFFDYSPSHIYADVFPWLPWLGLLLVATSVGEVMGGSISGGKQDKVIRMVLRIGILGIAVAALLFGVRVVLESSVVLPTGLNMHMLLSPLQKLPPGPVYSLFYGGCGFLMLFALMHFRDIRIVAQYSTIVEVIGRNSLFVFILQYFVYFSLFPILDIGLTLLWPLYFVISAAGIWSIAFLWEKRISRVFSQQALR